MRTGEIAERERTHLRDFQGGVDEKLLCHVVRDNLTMTTDRDKSGQETKSRRTGREYLQDRLQEASHIAMVLMQPLEAPVRFLQHFAFCTPRLVKPWSCLRESRHESDLMRRPLFRLSSFAVMLKKWP